MVSPHSRRCCTQGSCQNPLHSTRSSAIHLFLLLGRVGDAFAAVGAVRAEVVQVVAVAAVAADALQEELAHHLLRIRLQTVRADHQTNSGCSLVWKRTEESLPDSIRHLRRRRLRLRRSQMNRIHDQLNKGGLAE